jgi:hypothetical protein
MEVGDADLYKAFDPRKLRESLHEPTKEFDLRKAVKDYLKDEWGADRVAQEVPLDPTKARDSTHADILAFKKKLLGRELFAIELKSSVSRAAIREAFGQAKEYQRTCEYAAVCFSPMIYLDYLEEIDKELKGPDYKTVGVLVGSTQHVYSLRAASLMNVSSRGRDDLYEWISDHEYR